MDVKEPSGLLSASTSSSSSPSSMRPSDGELDRSFKFGRLSKFDAKKQKETRKERADVTVIQYHTPT